MAPPADREILLVRGSVASTDRLESRLRQAGYVVTAVPDAVACLDALRSKDFDAVIAPERISDLHGLNLVRAIRLTYPTLPFVFTPEEGSDRLAGDVVDAGVSAYVPVDEGPTAVIARVTAALRAEQHDDGTRRQETRSQP